MEKHAFTYEREKFVGRIFLTGDTHGKFDRIYDFCRRMETTTEDVMIVLGDAGINYFLNDRDDWLKDLIDTIPITVLCIHGNHEQRPYAITTYKEVKWHGGTVYVEDNHPSILFAKDGEIYDFNGKKAIAIGGAYSVDKYYRLSQPVSSGYFWYDNEQPSEEIKAYVEKQLDSVNWKIDYVLSHTVPLKYEPVEKFIPGFNQSLVDKSTEEWLDRIEDRLEYEKWFCGHYHTEKQVDNVRIMYKDYEELK